MRPSALISLVAMATLLLAARGVSEAGVPPPSSPAAAGPADTLRLSLEEAVSRALAQGEEMRLAAARVRAADGSVREALAQALPQVTGSVSYNRRFESIFSGVEGDSTFGPMLKNSPFAAARTWTADITASQLLFSGGKVGAGWRAAKAVRRASRAQTEEIASDLTYQVKKAYLDAVLAGRLLTIAEAALRQARDLLHDVELSYREGTRAEYDLLRSQVEVANAEPPVVAARSGRQLALLDLQRLVNVPFDQPLELTSPLAFQDGLVPVVADESETESTRGRAALQAADATVDARAQAVRAERGGRWPDITLSSTMQQQAFPQDEFPARDEFRRNWDATLRLDLPIFTGFRTGGAIKRARAQLQQAEVERDQLREAIRLEAAQARAELERALALLAARRETVRQAERAHYLAGVRYETGLATQLEVSDARLLLQTAEVNEVQATRDYLLALAQLERALGRPVAVTYRPLEEITSTMTPEGKER